MVSIKPLDRSSSFGAGNLEIRQFSKIESFSQAGLLYGNTAERNPYVRTNAFAFPLNFTCPSSSRSDKYVATQASRIGSNFSRGALAKKSSTNCSTWFGVPKLAATPDADTKQWIEICSPPDLRFTAASEGVNYKLKPMYQISDQRYSVYWQMQSPKRQS